jgi:hypothetical protein
MYTTFSKSKVALLACLLAIAFAGVASAFPSKGGGCSGCHTDPGGTMASAPNPLDIQLSSTGQLTFNVTDVPGGANTAICVQFSNATVFGNVSVAGGNLTWAKKTSSGNGITSSVFTAAGTYSLLLNGGASLGSSPLTLWLTSAGGLTTEYTGYQLNIIPAVPEPATLGLFLLGTVATVFRRGRRA